MHRSKGDQGGVGGMQLPAPLPAIHLSRRRTAVAESPKYLRDCARPSRGPLPQPIRAAPVWLRSYTAFTNGIIGVH
jgi:hypothetical protein